MRILVLTFYFQPDLCAGSFRVTPLVAELRRRAPPGTQIDVITTLPNRYHTFVREALEIENGEGFELRRIKLPPHRNDMVGQSRAFLRFAKEALRLCASRDYHTVFASSSRLMTATLAACIARWKGAALYLDVRDIFADTIKEVLPVPTVWLTSWFFEIVERWTMRRADRINLISPGFTDYFRDRYPDRSLSWFTNGIDEEFLRRTSAVPRPEPRLDPRAVVMYAGNIGEGQSLHQILPALARELRSEARFVVIGDGGKRAALERAVQASGADNIELRLPMSRVDLLDAYRSADVLFLHLGAHRAFEKVLPSKLFEYAALGKPVLAGVAGYAARFVREEVVNAAVFPPCDIRAAIRAFRSLHLIESARCEFVAKYRRSSIARAMADDIISVSR